MGRPLGPIKTESEVLADFWNKTNQRGPNECWQWTGAKVPGGYGSLYIGMRRKTGAHQYSWMIHNGGQYPKQWVLHSCDNPSCVNPNHLRLGTPKENTADSRQRGRIARDERHGNSKLTIEIVREIKNSPERSVDIAKRLGLDLRQISKIRTGRNWGHVK
jgi:hypothetical protein